MPPLKGEVPRRGGGVVRWRTTPRKNGSDYERPSSVRFADSKLGTSRASRASGCFPRPNKAERPGGGVNTAAMTAVLVPPYPNQSDRFDLERKREGTDMELSWLLSKPWKRNGVSFL